MVFTTEQKAYMVEVYLKTAVKVDDTWTYSIPAALAEFHQKYPGLAVQYKLFADTLQHSVRLFRETGSVTRKIGSGRPTKCTDENMEIIRNIITDTPTSTICCPTTFASGP